MRLRRHIYFSCISFSLSFPLTGHPLFGTYINHASLIFVMRTHVPEKLISIADQIKETGSVALTKLTVLKKWFERPSRLFSFSIFFAKNACIGKGKSTRQ